MVDINKLKELKEALKDGLITEEEYKKFKANIMSEPKPNLPNLLIDQLKNNNSSVHAIPANNPQHIIINNNNNNNNNNGYNSNGCYRNTVLHVILTLCTGGAWLFIWLLLALLKI